MGAGGRQPYPARTVNQHDQLGHGEQRVGEVHPQDRGAAGTRHEGEQGVLEQQQGHRGHGERPGDPVEQRTERQAGQPGARELERCG